MVPTPTPAACATSRIVAFFGTDSINAQAQHRNGGPGRSGPRSSAFPAAKSTISLCSVPSAQMAARKLVEAEQTVSPFRPTFCLDINLPHRYGVELVPYEWGSYAQFQGVARCFFLSRRRIWPEASSVGLRRGPGYL